MAGTTKVVYSGSLVDIVFEGGYAVRGEPIEVPLALAERLCEQRVWSLYQAPEPEPAPEPKAKSRSSKASGKKEE